MAHHLHKNNKPHPSRKEVRHQRIQARHDAHEQKKQTRIQARQIKQATRQATRQAHRVQSSQKRHAFFKSAGNNIGKASKWVVSQKGFWKGVASSGKYLAQNTIGLPSQIMKSPSTLIVMGLGAIAVIMLVGRK